jgi:uncharacterized protein
MFTAMKPLPSGSLCAVAALVVLSCGSGTNEVSAPVLTNSTEKQEAQSPAAPKAANAGSASAVQLANPASENCVKKDGKLEIHSSTAGQFGVCTFADGSRCEEWRLFRGECEPGECKDPDGQCAAKGN